MLHTFLYSFSCTCCSLCSSCVHLVWHGFHHVHHVFILFDMGFIIVHHVSWFLTWFSSCVFMFSLFVRLHGFHHFASCAGCESTQNVTLVLKKHQPHASRKAFRFTRILNTSCFLAWICFFVCRPKVLPHFPIPTTVLTAKEIAYLALVDVKTIPIKMAKNTPQEAPLAESDCLCAGFFLDQHVIWDENEAASKSRQFTMARVDFKPSIQK